MAISTTVKIQKKIGFILRHSPYGSNLAQEALDVVLAYAAFEQAVSVFFIDDGVFQLLSRQASTDIEQKSLEKRIQALSLYDIDQIYVCQESLIHRNLQTDILIKEIRPLAIDELSALIHQQDSLLCF